MTQESPPLVVPPPPPPPPPVPVTVVGGWLGIPQPVWQTFIAALMTAVLAWMQTRTNERVKQVELISRDTHTLVNSNNGTQLKIQAATSKRLAVITDDPVDVAEAKQAASALKDHVEAQKTVDAEKKKPDPP